MATVLEGQLFRKVSASKTRDRKPSIGSHIYIIMIAVAVVATNSLLLAPILEDVAASLGSTNIAISQAVATYGAGTMLSAFFLAPQIDRIGAGRALRFGLMILAVALLCSACAADTSMLMIAQAFAGISAGIILPASYTLATFCAEPEYISRSLGKVLFGWSLAFVLGIPGLALISDFLVWRVAYLTLLAITIFAVFEMRHAPDVGRVTETGNGQSNIRDALSRPNVGVLLIVCLCFTTAFYGVFAFLADQARQSLAISASAAGAIIFAFGIGFAAGTPATLLVDKVGARRLLPVVLLLNATVYGLMWVVGRDYEATLAVVVVWGAITNLSLNMIVLLLSQVSFAQKGRILGLNSATTYLGATMGVIGAGIFYDLLGFATVLWWSAVLQICGATLIWLAMGSRAKSEPMASAGRLKAI